VRVVNLPDIRDLVIIICGCLGIIALIVWTILGIWLFRRTRPILDNIETTSGNIRNMVDTIKEKFVDPAAQFMAMILGFKQIVEVIKQLFRKRQGGCDE
jgi:hypothetical protein